MKLLLKKFAFALLALLVLVGLVVCIEYFGGQPFGLFSGSRPTTLGFSGGKFALPSWKPNAVSSTVDKSDAAHFIAPLAYSGTSGDAWKKLMGVVRRSLGATVVTENANYVHAEFKSTGMGFVDDVEFALDEKSGVIQARSGSRLGVRDFGVNRKRIETIRLQLGK